MCHDLKEHELSRKARSAVPAWNGAIFISDTQGRHAGHANCGIVIVNCSMQNFNFKWCLAIHFFSLSSQHRQAFFICSAEGQWRTR